MQRQPNKNGKWKNCSSAASIIRYADLSVNFFILISLSSLVLIRIRGRTSERDLMEIATRVSLHLGLRVYLLQNRWGSREPSAIFLVSGRSRGKQIEERMAAHSATLVMLFQIQMPSPGPIQIPSILRLVLRIIQSRYFIAADFWCSCAAICKRQWMTIVPTPNSTCLRAKES